MTSIKILAGDCRETLTWLEDQSVQCCVTSPPVWDTHPRPLGYSDGTRAVGQELSTYRYITELAALFRLVGTKLRNDGTLWLHLSDIWWKRGLLGLPWRVAICLEADGWITVADLLVRPLQPQPQRFEPGSPSTYSHLLVLAKSKDYYCAEHSALEPILNHTFAHEAVIVGSRPGDMVLDCFGGNGQTANAALAGGRRAVLCELSPERAEALRVRFGSLEKGG